MSSPQQPTYLGCFHENIHSPDLTGEPPSIIARAEACFTHCSIGTWTYAAIRNRTICTCGDTFNKYGNASASACSTACPEDQSAFDDCGGPEANSVYSVAPIAAKPPVPNPSINPNVNYPTLHAHPDSNGSDPEPLSKTSRTAVISKEKQSLASPKTEEHGSMFDRQRSRESGRSIEDDRSAASTGQTWFSMGHRNRSATDRERGATKDMDACQTEVTTPTWPHRGGDLEKQLFEGFESSAIVEDHTLDHRPVHPLDSRPENHEHSLATSEILNDTHSRHGLVRQDVPLSTGAVTLQKPASFASKIGQKLSHLRVKTHLLPPGHHQPSAAGLSAATPPVPPISPISPISPGSSSSSSPTKMGFGQSSWEARRASDHEVGLFTGGSSRGDSLGATPSFSLATSPAAGTACNRRTKSMPKDYVPELPLLERLSSRESAGSHHSMDYHLEPLSPISPTHRDHSAPGASQVLANHIGKPGHAQDYRYQKQHRSNLIKDLILQGDSALDDKEQAMMAQYQPQHCRQQQQQQQQQQHQQQMYQSQHYTTHGPASSRLQHRRSSSSSATSKSMQLSKADQKTAPAQMSSEEPPFKPELAVASTPHSYPTESLLTVPPHQERRRSSAHIPMIDTNYLAPPPRILIHKAL
ncbi:unnamed protein product [Mortierella alpina]